MTDKIKDATPPATESAPAQDTSRDAQGRLWKRVDLDNPIKRGDQVISSVMVRKPLGGDMRGTEVTKLWNMDVDHMSIVIPRVTEPTIHRQDFLDMAGEDITSLCAEVVNFLLSKAQKAAVGLNA